MATRLPLHAMQRVNGRSRRFRCNASTSSLTCSSGSRDRSHLPPDNRLAFEQPDVARQQNPLLARRNRRKLSIVQSVAVESVEAKQAEETRERSEVDIGDESRLAQRLRAEAVKWRDVESLEFGIDRDALAAMQLVSETHRSAI